MRPAADFATLAVPGPIITAASKPFWDAASAGRLRVKHCPDCDAWIFYPRAICPHCWSGGLVWRDAAGTATLKTWSTVMRPAHPAWEAVAPYTIGLVELTEGPTMLTHLLIEPETLTLGLPLRVRFVPVGEHVLPCFEAA